LVVTEGWFPWCGFRFSVCCRLQLQPLENKEKYVHQNMRIFTAEPGLWWWGFIFDKFSLKLLTWTTSLLFSLSHPDSLTLEFSLSLCLHASNRQRQRHSVFRLSVRPSQSYLSNALTEFHQIWYKHSLGLKDELIRFWWSKVKGQVHCDVTKHEQIHSLIMTQFK